MINIYDFFKKNNIEFSTEQKGLNWVRNLKPGSLFRIGNSYFADEAELEKLLQDYAMKQIATRKRLREKRSQQAKKNFNTSKKVFSFQKQLDENPKGN